MPKIGKPKLIIGIDPGSTGAVCIWDHFTPIVSPLPRDIFALDDMFREWSTKSVRVVIEEIRSFGPQIGSKASFTFGHHYGVLEALMIAYRIPYTKVPPKEWQKSFSMTKKKGESQPQWKKRLAQRAKELFPTIRDTLKTDHADSVLIAEHGSRLFGESNVEK